MIDNNLLTKIIIKDIADINLNKVFLHYTNISNLNSIIEKGLEPKIGVNAKIVEKSKKIFFSMGDKGALVIMDVWLKWLIAKPTNNYIYWIGAYLLKIPYFPKFIHKIITSFNKKNKNKYYWAFNKLKDILDNSIYLILDLEENIDFSFNDIDEVKKLSNFPVKYIERLYAHNSNVNNHQMEYWNMHTYSNKFISKNKISLLKINNKFSANEIIKYLANENEEYVKNNCKLLDEYLKYLDANK